MVHTEPSPAPVSGPHEPVSGVFVEVRSFQRLSSEQRELHSELNDAAGGRDRKPGEWEDA